MLGQTKIKINHINIKSICFAALKKQLYQIKEETVCEENDKVTNSLAELKQDTKSRQQFDIKLDKELSLAKINKYLLRKAKQALSIWRKEHRRIVYIEKIASIISLKLQQTTNFAFSRILTRKFEKLKLSIKDKIASCDYSYNYLVQENSHIKGVLDKKSHELQKAKFVNIIERLIRKQKQIKHQYFYRFLRNGYKFWKVKKFLERIDHLMSKKIKLVLFFLLKLNKKQLVYQDKIQFVTNRHDQKQIEKFVKNSFLGFKLTKQRNIRMRRALTGIFDRNLEINFYQAFAKMRNQSYQFQIKEITQIQVNIQKQIYEASDNIKSTEQTIQILTQRLKNKQQTFSQRKTMSLYKFFLKNIKVKVGSYIWRWKNKIQQEKRIIKFVDVVNRKTQSMIKMNFLLAFQKTKGQLQKKQLQTRLERYKNEYEEANLNYDRFIVGSEEKSIQMKAQNQQNDKIAEQYEKKTQSMNNIKVQSFLRHWRKNICKFVFREWKNHKNQLIQKFNRIYYLLDTHAIRDAFQVMAGEIKFQLVKDRIANNLSTIYHKAYKHNVGTGFKVWRNVSILKKVKQFQNQLKKTMKGMQHIQNHYQNIKQKYYQQVDQRIHFLKLRKLTNAWRIYTQKKVKNNIKKVRLQKWLRIGYQAETINVLKRNKIISLKLKNKIFNFQSKVVESKAKIFLAYLYDVKCKKRTIQNLFINKFCFYQMHKIKEGFFIRIKNFYRQKQNKEKDLRTFKIQKIINCFQKKRKDILCQNMRIWKRNMYVINIQKTLLKRIVNNSMNSRVKDLFYAWKLQKQARFMVRQHTQQGQIKKRKVQIQRLKKFLDDYKKEKGLLLQNEEGNFVVSPKFQQNKQKQLKRDNVLKYKFISRLILAMNGYQAPIKAWNNLHIFMEIRKKCQKAALMVKNRIQKADLFTSFKIWHNGVKQLKKMFENMERKDLIRMLNKQKDKMQMQYSKKIEVQQKVQHELKRYKILAYQDKRKQRLCSQILFKEARKVKAFAFETWRKRIQQIKDHDAYDLQQRGNYKILSMQQQFEQMRAHQQQLQQNNLMLKEAVQEALQLAELIKRISQQRDSLRREFSQNDISCQNLQQENQELNNKLILAQKQAMNLLVLSGKGI